MSMSKIAKKMLSVNTVWYTSLTGEASVISKITSSVLEILINLK